MTDQSTTFQDNQNRTWKPTLDYVKLRAIRDKTGLDFGDVQQFPRQWASFLDDDLSAIEAIWIAVNPAPGNVSQDDWLRAMDGNSLERGREAMREAVVFFTPPKKRKMVADAIAGVTKGYLAAIAQAETAIQAAMTDATEAALDQLGTLLPSAPE